MQAIRDSLILLVLILLAVSIRLTPLEEIVDLIPEARAAAAEWSDGEAGVVPASNPSSCSGEPDTAPCTRIRLHTPPPIGKLPPPEVEGDRDDSRVRFLIEVERDRRLEAAIEQCPTDPDRSQEAPAAGAAC